MNFINIKRYHIFNRFQFLLFDFHQNGSSNMDDSGFFSIQVGAATTCSLKSPGDRDSSGGLGAGAGAMESTGCAVRASGSKVLKTLLASPF